MLNNIYSLNNNINILIPWLLPIVKSHFDLSKVSLRLILARKQQLCGDYNNNTVMKRWACKINCGD